MTKTYIPVALKQAVIERALEHCEYCLSPSAYSPEIFELEHVQPVAAGGKTEFSNLAFACPACNRYKSDRQFVADLDTGEIVPLFDPRTQIWREHFQWSTDLLMVEGLTQIGRSTVFALNMNRKSALGFR